MIRPALVIAAIVLVLGVSLGGCATTTPVGSSGIALGALQPDGTIRFKARRHGLFGTKGGEAVVFRPGEPGYDEMKAKLAAMDSGIYRPVLTWTIGEPILTLPPPK